MAQERVQTAAQRPNVALGVEAASDHFLSRENGDDHRPLRPHNFWKESWFRPILSTWAPMNGLCYFLVDSHFVAWIWFNYSHSCKVLCYV